MLPVRLVANQTDGRASRLYVAPGADKIATIIRGVRITALDADFPLAVPFTMVPDGPIRARLTAR